jgi:dTDP-4-amino-4,6-dideoxygalactose transaminase
MERAMLASETQKKITTQVAFIDLKRQYLALRDEILNTVDTILSSGSYILGDVVEAFEKRMATYLGCRYVLAVANGTDAIILALKAMRVGPGDEVILPANSFIATAGAVAAVGATPVLCDVNEDLNIDVTKIEALITPHTKAIIPVHLTGRAAAMDEVMALGRQHSLFVIEDAAQSIGATYHGKMTGAIGDVGCFSLHPLKNLRVYGDGGLISVNDERLYQQMKALRNHGLINRDTCVQWGLNSRLDALQAGIANIGLNYIDQWNKQRRHTADFYRQHLQSYVTVPVDRAHEYAVYHNFVVLTDRRDELMQFLAAQKIETKIHYPIPIHLQPAAAALGYKIGDFPMADQLAKRMLSLPVYTEVTVEEVKRVIEGVVDFFKK